MGKIKQIIAVIAYLKPLIVALESLFPGQGQGPKKKSLALQIIAALLAGADALGPLIDATVEGLNKDHPNSPWPTVEAVMPAEPQP